MNGLGFVLGALLITLFLSRVALWLMRSWQSGGAVRLALAHLLSFVVCTLIGGFGLANGDEFAGAKAAAIYGLPQTIWLVVDLIRHWLRSKSQSQPEY
jgi:hypothetical protein